MEQPPGFVAQRKSGLVFKLRHFLYSQISMGLVSEVQPHS